MWELLSKHNNVKFGFSGIQAAEDDGIGVSIPEYFYLFIGPGERSKRELIYKISDRFEDMFLKNCIRELPMYLVEYLKSAHDQIKLFEPDRKTIHVHIGRSVFMRLLVSKYAESGSKVIWYQHGSEMGEIEAPSGHYVQLSYCDEYRTWGWSTNEKEVPWKAYRLDGFKSTYQDYRHNKVNFDFLLCYPNLSDENRSRYTTITKTILYNLDSKYDRILARPRRSNKIHSHASELNFIKDRRVEKSTGLTHIADDISKCRLVIQMNVPSTNFLECVYSDIPTMGILNNPNPTEIINPFYDYFLTVGVLHDNFKALVQHLNDIEIEDWWQAIIKSTYYKEFKSCFTRNVNYPFNNEE